MSPRCSGRVKRTLACDDRSRRSIAWGRWLWVLIVGCALVLSWVARSSAQTEAEAAPTIFVTADRKITQALRNAQELLAEKRYSEAVRLLGSVLESSEDYFVGPDRKPPETPENNPQPQPARPLPPALGRRNSVPAGNVVVARSLKSEAQRLIGELPEEGRTAYELQFGTEAQRLLETASRAGQLAGVAEVSRRFFHTKAGHQATELLGTCLLERGQPQAAAFCFQRLYDLPDRATFEPALSLKLALALDRAGQREAALTTAQSLVGLVPGDKLRLDDRDLRLNDRSEWIAWLSRHSALEPAMTALRDDPWLMYRGNAARNAVSSGSTPLLNRRWAVPTLYDPEPRKLEIERLIEQQRQAEADQGDALLPGGIPLAVNDHVVFRTTLGVMAVNFRTGKRVWFQEDATVRQHLDRFAQETNANQPVATPPWLESRVWNDSIYGTLSSDGQFVFCVEDLPLEQPNPYQRNVFLPNGRQQDTSSRVANRLAVYSFARQGAIECDSSELKELAGAFFLGPPLPLDGRLYAIAEVKGEIRLCALRVLLGHTSHSPRSNQLKHHYRLELEWSQQLAGPERPLGEDPWRRTAGATPSFADGLLVCPTSAGAIVAVDLATRGLVWGLQYPREDLSPRHMMAFVNGRMVSGNNDRRGWVDGCVTIAQGKVFVSPVETSKLYCLNLHDGKVAWEADRGDGLYLGCVHQGQVLIVGSSAARALQVSDGKEAWKIAYPGEHGPSGRGFFAAGRYVVPLSSAEVIAIDVSDGRVVNRTRSRSGQIAGNLICYQGAVISQSAHAVESFHQLSDLETQVAVALKTNPQDPQALALRGDLLLDQGNYPAAIEDLRTSFKLRPDPRTRRLLFEALLERLRLDFAKHHSDLPELETLLEQPSQRLALLRVVATGQQQSGNVLAAFASYLKIIAEQPTDDLERLDRTMAVRRDRWVQARIKELREQASAADQPRLEQALREQLDEAVAAPTPELLRRFVDHFGAHPLANDAREALLARTGAIDSRLEEELLLRQLEQAKDQRQSAPAVARLARLLNELGRSSEGAVYHARLQGELAKVACLEGKTGAELARQWFGDRPPSTVTPLAHWPRGKVEEEQGSGSSIQPGVQNFPIDVRGPAGPFFTGWTVELVYQPQQALVAKDRLGREQWRVNIVDPQNRNAFFFQQQALNQIRFDGHLMVASLGFQLIGIDTLGAPGKEGPRILWRHDLIDPTSRDGGGMNWRQVNLPWGAPRIWAFDGQGRPLGATGPLSREGICFQRLRNLICVHPLTGKTLWTRYGITPGSELFGDDELLFVVASSGMDGNTNAEKEATVYRMLDGQELGKRKVPPFEHRLMNLGRKMLVWSSKEQTTVALRDLWEGKELWKRSFASGAKPWPIGDEAVAVLQRDGAFVMLNVADGSPVIDIQLREEPNLSEMAVHRSAERDFLFVNRPGRNGDGFGLHVVPQGAQGISVFNGWVYAFDRATGKLVWERAVERRSLSHHQPPDLPVIVFASLQQTPGGNGQQISVWCLDKRDGRILMDRKFPNQGPALELSALPDKAEVALRLNRGHARLTFTDKPPADAKPAEQPPKPAQESPPAANKAAAINPPLPVGGGQPIQVFVQPGQPGVQVQFQVQGNPGGGGGNVRLRLPPAPPVPGAIPKSALPKPAADRSATNPDRKKEQS